MERLFILMAVQASAATHVWGWHGVGRDSEGWLRVDTGHNGSLERNEYKQVKLMSSDEACKTRDAARNFGLSEHAIIIVPCLPMYVVPK